MELTLNENLEPGPYMRAETIGIINELCLKAFDKNNDLIWFSDIMHILMEYALKHFNEIDFSKIPERKNRSIQI